MCLTRVDVRQQPAVHKEGVPQRLRDLALMRRVRDRLDREYAQPLDVVVLADGVRMSVGHLCREFRRAYGASPYSYLVKRRAEHAIAAMAIGAEQSTTPIRHAGAPADELQRV
nr:AraC family transcriptional regulator [Phytoactinopolyspora halotolerans]